MAQETVTGSSLHPDARIAIPKHVVHRSFPSEIVVLNLQTGRYHGLNATAGEMLDELERSTSIRAAAAVLAQRYEQPPARVESDILDLCAELLERGLIEVGGEQPG